MLKVKLTTGHCNPPLTRTITCDTLRYFDAKHKVTMYDAKGKVMTERLTTAIQDAENKGLLGITEAEALKKEFSI